MTALAAARSIIQQNADYFDAVGVDTNVIVYNGAMIAKLTAGTGWAKPATATASMTVLGLADLTTNPNAPPTGQAPVFPDFSREKLDMTSVTAGSKLIEIRRGCFERENKAGDLVTNLHIGVPVYVEDDNTVRATAASTSVAGILHSFHPRSGKPMVMMGEGRGIL